MTTEKLQKLPLYKTAYSPLYEQYVGIESVIYDDDNEPIIKARMAHTEDRVLFRVSELTNFCL